MQNHTMQVKLSGSDGVVEGTIVAETQIDNRPFVVVNLGLGAFVKGVYSKFVVVPTHLIVDRNVGCVRVDS